MTARNFDALFSPKAIALVGASNNEAAELTVMMRSDIKGRGLGFRLMTELVDHARRRRLKRLFGLVLKEDQTMVPMAHELGFKVVPAEDLGLVDVSIGL